MTVATRQQVIDVRSAAPAVLTARQGVLLVGLDYAARRDQVVGTYAPAGLTAAWPNLLVGETPDLTTAVVGMTRASVAYMVDSSIVPNSTRGAVVDNNPSRIIHNGGATVWAGDARTTVIDVRAGDAVRLESPVGTFFYTQVAAVTYSGGVANILVLSDPVPPAMRAGYFNVAIAEIVDFTIPASALTLSVSDISVAAGLTHATARTVIAYPLLAFLEPDNTTAMCSVVTDYRAQRTSSPTMGAPVTVTEANLDSLFIGAEYPESEMGHAAYLATRVRTQGVILGANAAPLLVKSATGYSSGSLLVALTAVATLSTYAVIVPLSSDTSVIDATRTVVSSRNVSTDGLQTHTFITKPITPLQTPTQQVTQFIADVDYSDQHTVAVFPMWVPDTPDYIAIAAVAALRTIAVPGYSISYVEMPIEQGPERGIYAQFDQQLIEAGVLVVGQSPSGVTVVMRDATTDPTDETTLSEGIVSLSNAVRRALYSTVASMVNDHKINYRTATNISARLNQVMSSMQSWLAYTDTSGGLSFFSRSPSIKNFVVSQPTPELLDPTVYSVAVSFEVWHFIFDAKLSVQGTGGGND